MPEAAEVTREVVQVGIRIPRSLQLAVKDHAYHTNTTFSSLVKSALDKQYGHLPVPTFPERAKAAPRTRSKKKPE